MRERFTNWLLDAVVRRTLCNRKADQVIGGEDRPYMFRWFVIPRNRWFNIYFHHFVRSDDDRALHDHPWWNFSYLLAGEYVEHTIDRGGVHQRRRFKTGDFKFRFATYAHRIELTDGSCWTLFVTGPKFRKWFFHCKNGLVHWEKYTVPGKPGEVGPGCGDE